MRIANIGKKASEETKEKIRIAKLGKSKTSKYVSVTTTMVDKIISKNYEQS